MCVSLQNFIEIRIYVAEIYSNLSFLRRWPSPILDLWVKFWNDPQREFGGLYHCAKFAFNCNSHFDRPNTKFQYFARLA